MRLRLAEATSTDLDWEAKRGAGRLQDIELLGQTAALLQSDPAPDTAAQLQAGVALGWLDADVVQDLVDSHHWFWTLQAASRLLTGKTPVWSDLGDGAQAFIQRQTQVDSSDALIRQGSTRAGAAQAMITKALEQVPKAG